MRSGARGRYLEAQNAADEEQNEEDQADVAESGDLVLVGEVIRLQRKEEGLYRKSPRPRKRRFLPAAAGNPVRCWGKPRC